MKKKVEIEELINNTNYAKKFDYRNRCIRPLNGSCCGDCDKCAFVTKGEEQYKKQLLSNIMQKEYRKFANIICDIACFNSHNDCEKCPFWKGSSVEVRDEDGLTCPFIINGFNTKEKFKEAIKCAFRGKYEKED